jgi:hypothetical protein
MQNKTGAATNFCLKQGQQDMVTFSNQNAIFSLF